MLQRLAAAIGAALSRIGDALRATRTLLVVAATLMAAGYALYRHPPLKAVGRGEIGLRTNLLTGDVNEVRDGGVLVLPLLHEMRVFAIRDQVYRPPTERADGPAPLQSLEGLSLGVDLAVRYALDPARLRAVAASLPEDIAREIVEPAVQGVIYKTFARYTVREIFSSKRAEIQEAVEAELRARFAADGLTLRGVLVGKVDLPPQYRRGMEALLAEELANEKLRYTLQIREKTAEAVAREQVIAARAGGGDAPRAALQAAPDRAALARGRGGQGGAHQARRGAGRRAPHRGERRGRRTPAPG